MAWVQVGSRKINTTQICYVEQKGETLQVHFHGKWEGNPLELQEDEAKGLWRLLKAEDATSARDKGSATVLPRLRSAMPLHVGVGAPGDKPKPPSGTSGHAPSHSHHTVKHPEPSRHSEQKRH